MEATEEHNDAAPPPIEIAAADNDDIITLDDSIDKLDDSDVQIVDESEDPATIKDEPMPGETEAGREVAEAVIEHAGAAALEEPASVEDTAPMEESEPIEEPAIEEAAPIVESAMDDVEERADLEEGNTMATTPPMYDGSGAVDEPPLVETAEASGDVTVTADAEVKVESQPIGDESSQSLPESSKTPKEQFVPAELPETFPHCYICGFDRETVFKREKRASKNAGPHKNKLIYRNQCVRKGCNRFFGPSYVWNGTMAVYAKVAEESATVFRPYADGCREKKFPAIDYERAGPSGVLPPVENNGAWLRSTQAGTLLADPGTPDLYTSPRNSPAPPSKLQRATHSASSAPSTSSAAAASTSTQKMPAQKTAVAAKKLRKGYQWVAEEPVVPPRPDPIIELARKYAAQSAVEKATAKVQKPSRTLSTQTGDEDQIVLTLVEDLRTKAVFPGLRPSDVPMTPSNMQSMSNRLFITQKTLKKQSDEIKSLRSERDLYKQNFTKIMELLVEYKKTLVADATRLKEDVVVASKELRHFALEAQNEATKDLKEIAKLKVEVADRLDDMDRYKRKVEAQMEYQKSVTAEAESMSENYHRMAMENEKQVIMSKIEEEDAKKKLNDKIYLTNNAKCGHCQVNERIKQMLMEQVADKTMSANNLGEERKMLAKKLENIQKVVDIVSKENSHLKYEKAAWEANCHRFKSELMQLKGGNAQGLVLPSSMPSSSNNPCTPGEAAYTPLSSTTKDTDEVTPERIEDEINEVDRPQPTHSTSSAEEGEYQSPGLSPNTLARLPPPPLPPTIQMQSKAPSPPDLAPGFANWIPKDKKVQEMPPEMAEAMRRVAESLERGPPPKKDEKSKKKEKRDEKGAGHTGGKRSGGPQQFGNSHNKNGEKKPKLDGGSRKEEKVGQYHPPPSLSRPIPTLSAKGGLDTQSPIMMKKDKKREERVQVPSPVPFSSAHEPAFPAVVAPNKSPAVKVPYNGPSSLVAGGSSKPSSAASSPLPTKNNQQKRAPTPEKKKPLCFLPVAGSLAMPPQALNPKDAPTGPVTVDSIIRAAERLKAIERDRDRDHRVEQPRPYAAADRRPGMMGGGGGAPPSSGGGFSGGFDDDLPWNTGRGAGAPNYQQTTIGRPRTPVQDWYYDDAPRGGHGPPPHLHQQQRPPSPVRFYDDVMYNPHAPRDQFGRLTPDFGLPRQPHHHGGPPLPSLLHPHPHPHPHSLPPPGHRGAPPPQGPPPHDAWRREWHGEPPPRRNYWD